MWVPVVIIWVVLVVSARAAAVGARSRMVRAMWCRWIDCLVDCLVNSALNSVLDNVLNSVVGSIVAAPLFFATLEVR